MFRPGQIKIAWLAPVSLLWLVASLWSFSSSPDKEVFEPLWSKGRVLGFEMPQSWTNGVSRKHIPEVLQIRQAGIPGALSGEFSHPGTIMFVADKTLSPGTRYEIWGIRNQLPDTLFSFFDVPGEKR